MHIDPAIAKATKPPANTNGKPIQKPPSSNPRVKVPEYSGPASELLTTCSIVKTEYAKPTLAADILEVTRDRSID